MKFKKALLISILVFVISGYWDVLSQEKNKALEFSKAGFWEINNSGRNTFNFNLGWRFYKGNKDGAHKTEFNDSIWSLVNCPHGLEYLPDNASACNNYQGEVWYRKHFSVGKELRNKLNKLHFEGVMGKCKVWLNGELLGQHFGGYLPFTIDLSQKLHFDKENVLAIWVDNSDDASYPPGKEQAKLDFSYFGGIYRDVWWISTNRVFVTNPNEENKVADGGIFAHVDVLSDQKARLSLSYHIKNSKSNTVKGRARILIKNSSNKLVASSEVNYSIKPESSHSFNKVFTINEPELWTPWSPDLYRVEVMLLDPLGTAIDGVATKVGLRKIEFKGKEGFFLNGKPYPGKLMGANRHQDHAIVGNALPNNAQWRDAVILKNAGCDIVRAAHYPADPAFMEACDALGIFFIVATPGWQFWNKNPLFEQRVLSDIRNMVRRDRNHPSVILWEPILNETWYPEYFAKKVHDLVHEEYPYQGAYTACDLMARGQEHFDVIYSQPYNNFFKNHIKNTLENRKENAIDYSNEDRCVFTREWGDCVDDWKAHNSPSRVIRGWGECAQLVQAKHYSHPDYLFPSWETFYTTPKQHIGGAVWHSFDHQRGYHPDPFYGGITDAFRQPKYSYHMFRSQRNISDDNKPMVFIAHEMSPISQPDVTVFSNCESVRLIVLGKDTIEQAATDLGLKMPHPVFTFANVFNFMDQKELTIKKQYDKISIVAEGMIDGQVVARYCVKPSMRVTNIQLKLVNDGIPLVANGSDFVRVIASVNDAAGNIKRLDNSYIKFEVLGEGAIIGDETIQSNPRKLEWGTAPVLVRSTNKQGSITIKAWVTHEGKLSPISGELTFNSVDSNENFIQDEVGQESSFLHQSTREIKSEEILEKRIKQLEQEIILLNLKEVERQQSTFQSN